MGEPHAKFHVYRGNVLPLRGENSIFGPLSKNNTDRAVLRAGLPVKIPILAILGAVSRHFKSDNGEIWCEGTDLRHPTPRLIL